MIQANRLDTAGQHRTPVFDTTPGSPLEYALKYAGLGWHVIPVHTVSNGRCGCGNAACKNAGKHPITQLAPHGLKHASTSESLIRGWWRACPQASVAVVTGKISGIVVVDVDSKHGKEGEATLDQLVSKHGGFPDTVEAITPSGGRHLVFRYPTGIERIASGADVLGSGLDVRADDGYIVVEPSVHVTGIAYAWEGSSDPLEGVVPAELPGWLLGLMQTPLRRQPQTFTAWRALDTGQVLEIRAALGYISPENYDTWLLVGMALHSTGAGQQALGLWSEWAQGSPEKFNHKTQIKKWRSFGDKPNGIELASIFALAQTGGWVNPASREAQAYQERAEEFARLERQNQVQVVEEQAQPRVPFPVAQLEAAAHWITESFPLTHPVATDQAILALASLGAARLYVSPQGDPAHCYLGIAGRSVGDLRYVRTALHQALAEAGIRQLIRGTRFTSPQTLYQTLMRAPASLYATEEWGQLVAFAKRQPSGLVEQMLNVIADIHEARSVYLDSAADIGGKAGDEQPTIYYPSLSVLALMAVDQLEAVGRRGEWGRGSLEQMLIALLPEDSGESRVPQGDLDVPEWLVEHLRAVRRVDRQEGNLAGIVNGGIAPRLHPVESCASSDDHERFLVERIGQEDRRLRSLAQGGCRTLRRLCVSLAAWADPEAPVITRQIVDWVGEYVYRHLSTFVDRLQIIGSDDGRASASQKIVEMVVRAGTRGLSFRQLTQQVWAFKQAGSEKRIELIEQLLADKEIVEIETGGKRKRVFVASRFCVEAESRQKP